MTILKLITKITAEHQIVSQI